MKKVILISSLVSATLFGSTLQITETKTFSEKVKGDVVSTHFSVKLKSISMDILKKDIDKLFNTTKKYKECVNDEYSIFANQFYSETNNNKTEKLNYEARLGFSCSFKNVKEFSKLIDSIKKNNIKINNINNEISEKVKLETLKKLENRAYSYPRKREKELSKKLGMNCHLLNSNVYISNNYPSPFMGYRNKTLNKSMNIPITDKATKILSVDGRYRYQCQDK